MRHVRLRPEGAQDLFVECSPALPSSITFVLLPIAPQLLLERNEPLDDFRPGTVPPFLDDEPSADYDIADGGARQRKEDRG